MPPAGERQQRPAGPALMSALECSFSGQKTTCCEVEYNAVKPQGAAWRAPALSTNLGCFVAELPLDVIPFGGVLGISLVDCVIFSHTATRADQALHMRRWRGSPSTVAIYHAIAVQSLGVKGKSSMDGAVLPHRLQLSNFSKMAEAKRGALVADNRRICKCAGLYYPPARCLPALPSSAGVHDPKLGGCPQLPLPRLQWRLKRNLTRL